jgi:hypothetical protein
MAPRVSPSGHSQTPWPAPGLLSSEERGGQSREEQNRLRAEESRPDQTDLDQHPLPPMRFITRSSKIRSNFKDLDSRRSSSSKPLTFASFPDILGVEKEICLYRVADG